MHTSSALNNSPLTLNKRVLKRDRFALHFLDVGPKEAPAIVLCHGLGAGKEQFERDAIFFAQNGFRVIVPDLRGHGQSKTPEDFPESAFSLVAYANDIIELIKSEINGSVHFVGNSLGGLIGLTIMRLNPKLVRSFASFGTTYSLKISKFVMSLATFTNQLLPTDWVAKIGAKSISKNPDAQEVMHMLLRNSDPKVTAKTMVNIANYDLTSVAGNTNVPLLLLKGENDKQINDALSPTLALLEKKENAKIAFVPGAGHCANLDAPELVRQELLVHFAHAGA